MNTDHKLYKSIAIPALATFVLLLIPLVAMQFSSGVNWTLSDFIFAGILLFGTGLTYKLLTRKAGNTAYRVAMGFALFTGLFLMWVNAAVGIVGSENNPINIWYLGVIAVGIIGALLARFQPKGMAGAMVAMALTQAFVAGVALLAGVQQLTFGAVTEILAVNGFFIFLFAVSAILFRNVAQDQETAQESVEE